MTLTIRAIFLLLCITLASPVQLLRAAEGVKPAAAPQKSAAPQESAVASQKPAAAPQKAAVTSQKPAVAPQKPASYLISGIDAAPTAEGYAITIRGNCEPAYTKYELVNPLRIVLDIANASISDSVHLPVTMDKGPVSKIAIGRKDKNSSGTSLQLFMAADPDYKVSREDNDIVLAFTGDMKKIAPGKTTQKVKLTSIDIKKDAGETMVHLRANGPLSNFKYAELPASKTNPARLYIDLNNVHGDDIKKVISVGGTLAKIRTGQRGNSMRLVFDAKGKSIFNYQIDKRANGLDVKIADSAGTPADAVAKVLEQKDKSVQPLADIKKTKVAAQPAAATAKAENSVPDKFSFAGYNEKRITVDFYKIDLHNVFRLVGDISGKNIVVDEAVNGSLTLALNNVPWDFALDIIMNLKDLQMEERYNTIVISPKKKNFKWPEKAEDTMAIKANPLTVNKRIDIPPEVLEAKRLLAEAQRLEADNKYEDALKKYEDALKAWPDNAEIPTRMAAIYLVNIKLYPQAIHFAKEALKINGHDSNAALLAAIGLANMKMDAEAKNYFDIAVSAPKPSSEALLSYAAFQEEGGNYPAALAMLERHGDIYGDTLDTIITKARLYDKNGEPQKAVEEYRAALLSGNRLPKDLKRYIDGRLALGNQQ